MRITISTDFPQVAKRLDQLHADVSSKALARSVNRTMEQARTSMTREITKEFNIKRAKVVETLRIKRAFFKASRFTMEPTLESRTRQGGRRAINVINFGAKMDPKGKGVSVRIRRGQPRKTIKGAFIGNQGRTVFRRVGDARLPINAVQTIYVPQMFNTGRIKDVVVKLMREKFPVIFEREARFYLSKWKG
jgi:hypothetical protein